MLFFPAGDCRRCRDAGAFALLRDQGRLGYSITSLINPVRGISMWRTHSMAATPGSRWTPHRTVHCSVEGLHTGGGGDNPSQTCWISLMLTVDAQRTSADLIPAGLAAISARKPVDSGGAGNSYGAFSTIARQNGGPRFDRRLRSSGDQCARSSTANGHAQTARWANLSWSQSDNGGLTISGYSIYRRFGVPARRSCWPMWQEAAKLVCGSVR